MNIRSEFQAHDLNDAGIARTHDVAKLFSVFLNNLEAVTGADGRAMALVRTKLQEAKFFAVSAVAESKDNQKP
jgi:hypothetical protein